MMNETRFPVVTSSVLPAHDTLDYMSRLRTQALFLFFGNVGSIMPFFRMIQFHPYYRFAVSHNHLIL